MKRVLLITCPVILAAAAFAASPVATISSSSTFELRGAEVKADGVPSWPMMAGDDIRTSDASAVIQFRDGTRVTLGQKSRAKVEKSEDGLLLRLLTGGMQFNIASGSTLKVFNANKPVAAAVGVTTTTTTSGGAFVVGFVRRPPPPNISQ